MIFYDIDQRSVTEHQDCFTHGHEYIFLVSAQEDGPIGLACENCDARWEVHKV